MHMRRVNAVRPRVDSASPRPCPHLQHRLKQIQIAEDRCTEIERANRILLEKMSTVMNAKPPEFPLLRPKSLNKILRKRALAAINAENQAILKRLQQRTASYNITSWRESERKTEELLRLRCEYPYQLTSRPRTRSSTPISTRKNRSAMNEEDRLVVYRGKAVISDRECVVEMSTDKRLFWITVFGKEGMYSGSVEMKYAEAMEIAGEQGYEGLVEGMSIQEGVIVVRPTGAVTVR